jgi:hypothetical protein
MAAPCLTAFVAISIAFVLLMAWIVAIDHMATKAEESNWSDRYDQ